MEFLKKIMDENKNNYTPEFFEKLDKELSFGLKVEVIRYKKPKKIIFTTQKEIFIHIKKLSETNYEISLPSHASWSTFSISPEKLKETPYTGVYRKGETKAFSGKHGISTRKVLQKDHMLFECEGQEELEVLYELRVKEMSEIAEKFGVNARKNFYSSVCISRAIAYQKFKAFNGCSHVDEKEKAYIEGSTRGALQFALKRLKISNCFEYDINTMYATLMNSPNFRFPLTYGEKNTKLAKDGKNTMTISKLRILGQHAYWKNTKDNYYNDYHIEILKLLIIPYEIEKKEEKEDIYFYDECVNGNEVFGYLKDIFELKQKGNTHAKSVLSCTWGALCREKNFEVLLEDLKEEKMRDVVQINYMKGYAIMKAHEHPYKHFTARLKPFLFAFARLHMIKNIILPLEKKGFRVYQSNTDCVITNANPEEMNLIYPLSKNMGDLKLAKEYKEPHMIQHVRLIVPCNDFVDELQEYDEIDDDCDELDDDYDFDDIFD